MRMINGEQLIKDLNTAIRDVVVVPRYPVYGETRDTAVVEAYGWVIKTVERMIKQKEEVPFIYPAQDAREKPPGAQLTEHCDIVRVEKILGAFNWYYMPSLFFSLIHQLIAFAVEDGERNAEARCREDK